MIKVTVTGSECTGKTTLARALAERYRVELVPEFARDFVQQAGRAPVAEDVEAIARGQIEREDEFIRQEPQLLILDTDLLSTWVYGRHYYENCPSWIGAAVEQREADLYLLCDIDVPWVADGMQRDRPEARPQMQALFRSELMTRDTSFVDIRGERASRLETAVVALNALLARR